MDTQWLDFDDQPLTSLGRELLPRMRELWNEAGAIWDQYENAPAFRGFVAADYEEIFRALLGLQGQAANVLEWGSGLGVIAIMADSLGFEAYGIESEPDLVEMSRDLADKYGANVQFGTGNFVPSQYQWDPQYCDENFRTMLDVEPAYDQFDMELRDFDLVYAYPWPEEVPFYHDVLRKCGSRTSLFLSYDAREGVSLSRFDSS